MESTIKQTFQSKPDVVKRQWLAQLGLTFKHSMHGTQLVQTKRTGPLSVQKAFYPEGRDTAHIYLLHPPAGIVSGDVLRVNIELQQKSHVLVTTPGANRFYKARLDHNIGIPEQKQITEVHLEAQSICENFPLETIVYEGAEGINQVVINLAQNSVYLGWDMTCLGLPSSKQPFESGKFNQLNQVFCDGKLIYHDRIAINPDNQVQQHSAGLAGKNVFATFLAYASQTQVSPTEQTEIIDKMRVLVNEQQLDSHVSITHINHLIIMRYLGQHAEQCKTIFTLLWQQLRPLYLKKQGIVPRIWHT